MSAFTRDKEHWLYRFSPKEWIRAALGELRRAEKAYAERNLQGGLAGAKRAAGMALNAALIGEPNEAWGRSYVDHVLALERDLTAPEAVRAACKLLLATHAPNPDVITLRSPRTEVRVIEAARDVMAHAYAVALRSGVLDDDDDEPVSGLVAKPSSKGDHDA